MEVSAELISRINLELPGWQIENNELCKQFVFANFVQAWHFMTDIASVAEDLNHHPDWRNVYNRVWVRLSTHDAGGITVRDIELALAMEQAASCSASFAA